MFVVWLCPFHILLGHNYFVNVPGFLSSFLVRVYFDRVAFASSSLCLLPSMVPTAYFKIKEGFSMRVNSTFFVVRALQHLNYISD